MNEAHRQSLEVDRSLIAGANRGDEAAMEALFRRYRDWVYGLALRLCRHREDALDVVQETFLYLFRQFPGFALRHRMKTFLYPVVRNLAIDRSRRQARAGHLPLESEPEAAPPSEPDVGRRELGAFLTPLSDEQREVVLMRFADDLSLAEIAEALGVPVGTVKSRLHYALETLRGRLEPDRDSPGNP